MRSAATLYDGSAKVLVLSSTFLASNSPIASCRTAFARTTTGICFTGSMVWTTASVMIARSVGNS